MPSTNLRGVPTYKLVEELETRDYVRTMRLDTESYRVEIEGPAVVLIVTD